MNNSNDTHIHAISVSAVILAGGLSSRMGRDKALLMLGDRTFAQLIASQMTGFDAYILSANKEDIVLPGWLRIADNYQGMGPVAGLEASLKAASAFSEWAFVVSCDTPLVSSALIERIAGFCDDSIDAVIPIDISGRIHPLCGMYRCSIAQVFEKQLKDNKLRLRSALEAVRVRYVQLSEEESGLLMNVNDPESLQALYASQQTGPADSRSF